MKIGLMAPQGWKGEYDRWDAARAWSRTAQLASEAEALGFESLWVFDHFHTVPRPSDEITFESFATITAIAGLTHRVRLGQLVVCTGFRNPALTAKIASTIDVISGGRFELGLGAGWKEDEWRAYGYGFPTLHHRLAALDEHLQVVRRMLEPGRATFEGRYAHVRGAINEPKGLQQPRLPIVVGGNGETVTWRLAARYADELNVAYLTPDEVEEALPVIAQRCEEQNRDPGTLRLSVYAPDQDVRAEGQARVDTLARYAELGLSRVIIFLPKAIVDPDAQARLAADARAAGLVLAEPSDVPAKRPAERPGAERPGAERPAGERPGRAAWFDHVTGGAGETADPVGIDIGPTDEPFEAPDLLGRPDRPGDLPG